MTDVGEMLEPSKRILLVDDDEDDYLMTRDLLAQVTEPACTLEWRSTYHDGLAAILENRHDLYLLDFNLGARNGIELVRVAVESNVTAPILLLTAQDNSDLDRLAAASGATDYLVKSNVTAPLLGRAIRYALARYESNQAAQHAADEVNAELAARSEERQRESERLLIVARTDPLTEAANRLHLHEDLEAIADRARRYGHQYCAAFCDIDFFKSYNDTFGHLAGDGAIRIVSQAFKRELRKGDGFYRYGGDEFLVILPEQSMAKAWDCMERVRKTIASIPVTTDENGPARSLTISVGIADFRITKDEDAIQSWLKRADTALYRAKARGRNCVHISGQTASPLPSRIPVPMPEGPKLKS
jgi:diguanylate cyclase (GGDEF)-like protein